MSPKIIETMAKLVNRITRDLQEIPREVLDEMVSTGEREMARRKQSGTSAAIVDLLREGLDRARLVRQWANQAHEQLHTDLEMNQKAKTAIPDLVDLLMKRGGPRE